MAFAGKSDKKENVTAAIAANIWMTHERGARTALPDETLGYIVMDCLVSEKEESYGVWSSQLALLLIFCTPLFTTSSHSWVLSVLCTFDCHSGFHQIR